MEDFEGERSAHLLAGANRERGKVSRAKRHPGKPCPKISDLCKKYKEQLADLQNKMGWAKESCKKLGKELADLETKMARAKESMKKRKGQRERPRTKRKAKKAKEERPKRKAKKAKEERPKRKAKNK